MAGLKLRSLTVEHSAEKILVFGDPKTGKTTLAGAIGTHFNVHYIGVENGHSAFNAVNFPDAARDNISVYPICDTKKLPTGIETVINIFRGGTTEWCLKHGKVTTKSTRCPVCKPLGDDAFVSLNTDALDPAKDVLVIDSGTQLTDSMKNLLMLKDIDDLSYEALKKKLEFDHYEAMGKLCRELMGNIQNFRLPVIFITHVTENTAEDGTKKLMPTFGTSNFSLNVGRYFGHMVYTEVKNGKFKVASSPGYKGNLVVGSRTGIKLEDFETPSLLPLLGVDVPKPAVVAAPKAASPFKRP